MIYPIVERYCFSGEVSQGGLDRIFYGKVSKMIRGYLHDLSHKELEHYQRRLEELLVNVREAKEAKEELYENTND